MRWQMTSLSKNCPPEPSAGEAEDERGICSPSKVTMPLAHFLMLTILQDEDKIGTLIKEEHLEMK